MHQSSEHNNTNSLQPGLVFWPVKIKKDQPSGQKWFKPGFNGQNGQNWSELKFNRKTGEKP